MKRINFNENRQLIAKYPELKGYSIEKTISYLISIGSISYDYNRTSEALEIFKIALNLCLNHEDDAFPRFKNEALEIARNIQFAEKELSLSDEEAVYERKVHDFYNKRYSFT